MNNSSAPARSKVLFFVAAFPLLFGAIFASTGWFLLSQEIKGVLTQGTVLGKHNEQRKERNGLATYHYVRYRFTPEGAAPVETEAPVAYELYERLTENGPIQIEYDPAKPDLHEIAGNESSSKAGGYVFLVIGLLIMSAGGAVLAFEIGERRKISRLMSEGMVAEATIESVGPGSLSINRVAQWRIAYTFQDMHGKSVSAQSCHMAPALAQKWQAGQTGKVRYDRNNSKLNMWIGS